MEEFGTAAIELDSGLIDEIVCKGVFCYYYFT